MTRALLVGAFACHLALVVAGATHLASRVHGPVGRELRFYDALSGAGDSYSFFAPAVGPQLRARFTLSTPEGDRTERRSKPGRAARPPSAWEISPERSTSSASERTSD